MIPYLLPQTMTFASGMEPCILGLVQVMKNPL